MNAQNRLTVVGDAEAAKSEASHSSADRNEAAMKILVGMLSGGRTGKSDRLCIEAFQMADRMTVIGKMTPGQMNQHSAGLGFN